jgi:hypothetical protein
MAIIAEHCLPGASRNPSGWLPRCAWPGDCLVQWGGHGVVLGTEGTRRTAFFEAFPVDPPTFIRGEGADVVTAEAAAFAQFGRQRDCPGHRLERAGYRNGAGICAHCGLFVSKAFAPLADPDTSGPLGAALAGDPVALARVWRDLAEAFDPKSEPKGQDPA